jgi:hypothetical protein
MHFRIVLATLLTSLTYSQAEPLNPGRSPAPQLRSYTKAPTAKARIKTTVEDFVLWIDQTKWKQEKSDTPGMLIFSHVNGEAYALVISGPNGAPTPVLRDRFVNIYPNSRITFEEKRTVNGRQVLATEMSITKDGAIYRFFGYYHGGSSGGIAVIGYTAEALFSKNIREVTEFLNGLEISDQELPSSANRASSGNRDVLPSPGLLLVNSRVSIKYDPKKWERHGTDEIGYFTFIHASGEVYAIVASGRFPPPIESVPDMALSIIQSKDPTATIVFKEMRRVNDSDVWFLKTENRSDSIPFVSCGYFYSGKSGGVSVIAFTRKSQSREFEKDLMDFLNGLSISE